MDINSNQVRPPSTVWGLLAQWYGSWLKTRRIINDFTVAQAAVRLCVADPSRVLLQIANWGADTIAYGENRNIGNQTGWILAPGNQVCLDWQNDLDLMTTEIWAIAQGGSNPVHVVESLLIGENEATTLK